MWGFCIRGDSASMHRGDSASSTGPRGTTPESDIQWLKQFTHLAGAVRERIELDTDFVQECQMQVG